MTDLNALLERVRSFDGSDPRLGYDICVATGYTSPPVDYREYKGDILVSIDAALALTERVLPDNGPNMVYCYDLNWHASAHTEMAFTAELFVAEGDPAEMTSYHGQAHTLPLAILAATLTALIASEPKS